ncbi:hypothetical protein [Sedimenticola thiotaurini]|uniref:Uncharacterized protein n=1 Tax=Sedimenticola thiotaurini TaxID=1543721 RepID=A0A0F7JYV6_9GAMM|nr:hypothetical protein [Sedimenticola thiotaurini]AKH20504.1 hypothetical protein AAY24_09230 [Sedimenticola thiotaurini]
MKQKPFLLIMVVLIGVIIYAYNAPEKSPESASTLTPKQYIELVEKKKEARRAQDKQDETRESNKTR